MREATQQSIILPLHHRFHRQKHRHHSARIEFHLDWRSPKGSRKRPCRLQTLTKEVLGHDSDLLKVDMNCPHQAARSGWRLHCFKSRIWWMTLLPMHWFNGHTSHITNPFVIMEIWQRVQLDCTSAREQLWSLIGCTMQIQWQFYHFWDRPREWMTLLEYWMV